MTQDFDHVRAAFASSLAGRMLSGASTIAANAWRTSAFASAMRRASTSVSNPVDRTRTVATAIAIAALLQPPLIVMMPRVARPWMPWIVFLTIAAIAVVAAARPDAVAIASRHSRIARWLRR